MTPETRRGAAMHDGHRHRKRPLRLRVRSVLEHPTTKWGRRFAIFIQALIILSLLAISLETIPNLPAWVHVALHAFEWFVILVFTVEYALRLWSTAHPVKYALSFHGLVDLAVIAPFWILGADVREIRGLVLLRLIRVFKLGRYARSLKHFRIAWQLVKDDVFAFAAIVGLFIYIAAIGIWHFEHTVQPEKYTTVFEALWWAVITLTTVGYGDVYPVTTGGRLFTMVIVLLGLGLVAVPSGLLASAFQEIRRRERERQLRRQKWHTERPEE